MLIAISESLHPIMEDIKIRRYFEKLTQIFNLNHTEPYPPPSSYLPNKSLKWATKEKKIFFDNSKLSSEVLPDGINSGIDKTLTFTKIRQR